MGFRNPAGRNAIPGLKRNNAGEARAERFRDLAIEPRIWDAVTGPNGENPYAAFLSNKSPWFAVSEGDVDVLISYAAWNNETNSREPKLEIGKKALEMISRAREYLVASVFLFDNMYSENPDPEYDIVDQLFQAIERQKRSYPNLKVVIVLDPLHRAYANRLSPVVEKFLSMGIDVFYTDLLRSKASNNIGRVIEPIREVGRGIDTLFGGLVGSTIEAVSSAVPVPVDKKLDGQQANFLMIRNAVLIKANHRKLLTVKGSDGWHALVSSANPHNASGPSANTALSIRGAGAKYIYNVIRSDVANSLLTKEAKGLSFTEKAGSVLLSEQSKSDYKRKFGKPRLERYLTEHLPHQPIDYAREITESSSAMRAKFTTEEKIKEEALRILNGIQAGDEVRLQMFYLADPVIVDAIIAAAKRKQGDGKPFRLLLDANKDAFNSIKDGSPNRQVAHFLMNGDPTIKKFYSDYKRGALNNIVNYSPDSCSGCFMVRWFATHGEQNHAKLISVTSSKKNIIFTGSSNWTRKNMGDVGILGRKGPINLESNLTVENVASLNEKYNQFFDNVWDNDDEKYDLSDSYDKWDISNSFYLTKGHLTLKEQGISSEQVEARALKAFDQPNPHLAVRDYYIQVGRESGAKMDEEWVSAYMLKWPNGEKAGLVSW